MGERINELSLRELGFSILAIVVAAGLVVMLWYMTGIDWLGILMIKIVEEVPRTLYFFGSSVGGVLIAASFDSLANGKIPFGTNGLLISFIFLVAFFLIGFFIRQATIARTRE